MSGFLCSKTKHEPISEVGVRMVLSRITVSVESWEQGWVKQAQNKFGNRVSGSLKNQHFLGTLASYHGGRLGQNPP